MAKILFFEVKKDDEVFFKKNLNGHELIFFEKKTTEVRDSDLKNVLDANILCVFIHSELSSEFLSKFKKLKMIATRSTGFDHIDIDFCRKNGIIIGNVPFYGENTVAEHTFALILNLSRKVHKSYLRTIHQDYSIDGLIGFDLQGKTLGVIGVGHIGLHVIRIAKGFGMHVKAFDVKQDKFMSQVLHYEYADVDDIIENSDIISLHLPLNDKTYHFIGIDEFKRMKSSAIIINTSRGGLIDTQALYEALDKKLISGAGLDVIEGEEIIKNEEQIMKDTKLREKIHTLFTDKKLLSMENVIFTPHNAFNSLEAVERILEATIENIEEFTQTGKVIYEVKN